MRFICMVFSRYVFSKIYSVKCNRTATGTLAYLIPRGKKCILTFKKRVFNLSNRVFKAPVIYYILIYISPNISKLV